MTTTSNARPLEPVTLMVRYGSPQALVLDRAGNFYVMQTDCLGGPSYIKQDRSKGIVEKCRR